MKTLLLMTLATAGGAAMPQVAPSTPVGNVAINVAAAPYNADPTGKRDSTKAIQSAIDSESGYTLVYIPKGRYLVTSPITISHDRTVIYGDGKFVTTIEFVPNSPSALLRFKRAHEPIVQCAVRNIGFSGTNNQDKTVIDAIDVSEFTLEDVGAYPWKGGKVSVGLSISGRQDLRVRNVDIWTDLPVLIKENPNSTISLDHASFSDVYFVASNNPVIRVESGVNMSNVTFSGGEAWVGGTYGLYWNDTTSKQSSYNVRIENARWEQSQSTTGYMVYISHRSGLTNLSLEGLYATGSSTLINGIYLQGVSHSSITNSTYTGSQVGLDTHQVNDFSIQQFYLSNPAATVQLAGATNVRGMYYIQNHPSAQILDSTICADPACRNAIDTPVGYEIRADTFINRTAAASTCTGSAVGLCDGTNTASHVVATTSITTPRLMTEPNCVTKASPALCRGASGGAVSIGPGDENGLVVYTSAVGPNSQVFLQADPTIGKSVGVVCPLRYLPILIDRVPGKSITIGMSGAPSVLPSRECVSFFIVN